MATKPPTSYGDLKTQPQRAAYGLGYRSGMEDLALKIRDEGLAGAIQWIRDNGDDAAREALATVDVETTVQPEPDDTGSRARVREYLRQRAIVRDVGDEINGVHGAMARLLASDLTAVLAAADVAASEAVR